MGLGVSSDLSQPLKPLHNPSSRPAAKSSGGRLMPERPFHPTLASVIEEVVFVLTEFGAVLGPEMSCA